ncbi:MFS transporter [Terrabacter lapilli]|uniref:MFS transporter n=1 Tax=Terrabacter lapilli TaxID=436231 RepID=A0ABN2RLP4_9MICO
MSTTTMRPSVAFAGTAGIFAVFFLAAGAPTPLLGLRQQQWGFSAGLLTIAFSVYAVALLVALLVGGSLSDHLGRRPVLLGALVVETVSMVGFLLAPSIGWLIVARVLQGVATGLGTSAFSAAIAEHAPAHLKKLAGGLSAASVAGGLGLGALLTGAAIQLTDSANTIVFAALTALMLAAIVFVLATPETGVRRPGARRSLAPTIAVPTAARGEFLASIPVHVAGWMFPAFFLGLSPAVLRLHFGLHGGLVTGFTAFVGPFAAAVAGFVFARHDPRRGTLLGLGLVLLGMIVVFAGVTATVLPLVWVGALLGGAGFGGTFGGQVRLIAPHAGAHQRASLFSAVYTVAYLAFGVPVVIAGQLAPRWGLVPTFDSYAAVVVILALLGLAVQGARAIRQGQESETLTVLS